MSVLPTMDGKKWPHLPTWEAYQKRLPTPQELVSWFPPRQEGLGLVLGKVSGNLEALDFDRHDTFSAFCEIMRGIGDKLRASRSG